MRWEIEQTLFGSCQDALGALNERIRVRAAELLCSTTLGLCCNVAAKAFDDSESSLDQLNISCVWTNKHIQETDLSYPSCVWASCMQNASLRTGRPKTFHTKAVHRSWVGFGSLLSLSFGQVYLAIWIQKEFKVAEAPLPWHSWEARCSVGSLRELFGASGCATGTLECTSTNIYPHNDTHILRAS